MTEEDDEILLVLLALLHLRREKRWRTLENNSEMLDLIPSTAAPALEDVDSEFLRLVEQVSPASRAVLLLHYQQHLSLEDCDRSGNSSWNCKVPPIVRSQSGPQPS
jgi:hypothetical protein